MNATMVKLLVLKDWYFLRWPIFGYLAAGALALALLSTDSEGAFYAGSILLLTVLISAGIHVAMATVVQERTDQTLPFVMSLPVSPREYTIAKLLANVLIFLVPWLILLLGTLFLIVFLVDVPDGLIPFTVLLLTELFVGYVLILAVALISESQGWAIGAIVFANLFFQGFMYVVSHMPSIADTIKGPVAVWSGPAVALLVSEIVVIVLLLGLTFYLQDRKTDFL